MILKFLMIWSAACLVAGQAPAQVLGDLVTARSASGQFTARSLNQNPYPIKSAGALPTPMEGAGVFVARQPQAAAAGAEVKLVPALLIVSCDRIKNAFPVDLGEAGESGGRIDLFINASRPEDQGSLLTAVRGQDDWRYELELPAQIKPEMLMRAIVAALLLERANRDAGDQSAEIPLWLIEGLSAHLQAYNLPTFFVQPHIEMVPKKIKLAEQEAVREQLRSNDPLTFQQLSWPDPTNLAAENFPLYSNCAQLFFEELLRFPDGRRCLRGMLQQLAHHLNWQTAFLTAFGAHFAQLRDVEKWWGLACADFCGHDLTPRRAFQESWKKIQDALDVPVEVQFSPDRLATPAEVTLEEVIMEWKLAQVVPVLERCIQNLELLRFQVTPELSPLADAYRLALQKYLRESQNPGPILVYKKDAAKQLRLLDEQREKLRQKMAGAK
jgi:hypothetical protein